VKQLNKNILDWKKTNVNEIIKDGVKQVKFLRTNIVPEILLPANW